MSKNGWIKLKPEEYNYLNRIKERKIRKRIKKREEKKSRWKGISFFLLILVVCWLVSKMTNKYKWKCCEAIKSVSAVTFLLKHNCSFFTIAAHWTNHTNLNISHKQFLPSLINHYFVCRIFQYFKITKSKTKVYLINKVKCWMN